MKYSELNAYDQTTHDEVDDAIWTTVTSCYLGPKQLHPKHPPLILTSQNTSKMSKHTIPMY